MTKDYAQLEGLDFHDTFLSITKLTTIRLLFSIVVINNCHLKQLYVNNAFLRGELREEVYMHIPSMHDAFLVDM